MGVRNMLILFFSALAISLVILILFFSIFFKNVDFSFNAKLPESAPDVENNFDPGTSTPRTARSNGLQHANVNVPQDLKPIPIQPVGVGAKAVDETTQTKPDEVQTSEETHLPVPATRTTKPTSTRKVEPEDMPEIPTPAMPPQPEERPSLPSQQGTFRNSN